MKEENIWEQIINSLHNDKRISLLLPKSNSQNSEVINISDGYIRIQFQDLKTKMKIEKIRFLSAYKMLEENKGQWVKIGASQNNTKPDTLEGRIKLDFNGNLNGFMTATWIAAILVKVFNNIEFNNKHRGKALRMTDKSK